MSSDIGLFLSNVRALLNSEQKSIVLTTCKLSEADLNDILDNKKEPTLSLSVAISKALGVSLERLLTKDLTKRRGDIKFLVLDVDGVLTEGGMYYTQTGDEFKRFNTRDGIAIKKLTKENFQVAFLSSGINHRLVENRAELLGVQKVYVGLEKKFGILDSWRKELGLEWSEIAYIGDDVNDLEVIGLCGFTACPADATEKVKAATDIILKKDGGHACVREFIEEYLIEV